MFNKFSSVKPSNSQVCQMKPTQPRSNLIQGKTVLIKHIINPIETFTVWSNHLFKN